MKQFLRLLINACKNIFILLLIEVIDFTCMHKALCSRLSKLMRKKGYLSHRQTAKA